MYREGDNEPLQTGGAFLLMDFVVYILFSESANKFYTGHTQNLENRLIEQQSRRDLIDQIGNTLEACLESIVRIQIGGDETGK